MSPTIEVILSENQMGRCMLAVEAFKGDGKSYRLWWVEGVDDPHGKGYCGITCKIAVDLANGYALKAGRTLDVTTLGFGVHPRVLYLCAADADDVLLARAT
jgi:hypothetical protein